MSDNTSDQEPSTENGQEQVLAIKRTIINAWISDFLKFHHHHQNRSLRLQLAPNVGGDNEASSHDV
jgi:hypothetical protein